MSTAVTSGSPMMKRGIDMIEHSDRVRSGCRIATCWAIIPPIEAPTMCAESIPRASSTPTASSAMSERE